MSEERWVMVPSGESTKQIVNDSGCRWDGPSGRGTKWKTDLSAPPDQIGITWESDAGETRTAPNDLTRWWPSQDGWMIREADALAAGYSYPPHPVFDPPTE